MTCVFTTLPQGTSSPSKGRPLSPASFRCPVRVSLAPPPLTLMLLYATLDPLPRGMNSYRYYLCEAYLGKSHLCRPCDVDQDIPRGCDSFVLEGEEDSDHAVYVIKNPNNVPCLFDILLLLNTSLA